MKITEVLVRREYHGQVWFEVKNAEKSREPQPSAHLQKKSVEDCDGCRI